MSLREQRQWGEPRFEVSPHPAVRTQGKTRLQSACPAAQSWASPAHLFHSFHPGSDLSPPLLLPLILASLPFPSRFTASLGWGHNGPRPLDGVGGLGHRWDLAVGGERVKGSLSNFRQLFPGLHIPRARDALPKRSPVQCPNPSRWGATGEDLQFFNFRNWHPWNEDPAQLRPSNGRHVSRKGRFCSGAVVLVLSQLADGSLLLRAEVGMMRRWGQRVDGGREGPQKSQKGCVL